MLRIRAFLALAFAVLLAAPAAAHAGPAVKGNGFRASAPDGWVVKVARPSSTLVTWSLATPGNPLDAHAVPTAPGAGITIFRVVLPKKERSKTLSRQAIDVVGTPPGATKIAVEQTMQKLDFAGVDGRSVGFSYTYKGRLIAQYDVLARRGNFIYGVEGGWDAPGGNDVMADAIADLLKSWRWT